MCNISQGIREEALIEGRTQRNLEIAKKMLLKNMPIKEIIEFTELPRQTILGLGKS